MLDVFTPLQTVPIVALAAGAAAALAFNFLGARLWAFRLESARPTLSDRQ
jgi:putative flippase GtrA